MNVPIYHLTDKGPIGVRFSVLLINWGTVSPYTIMIILALISIVEFKVMSKTNITMTTVGRGTMGDKRQGT